MPNYDSTFEKIVNHTLNLEGGLVNDPNDKGGLTKYGISQNSYKNLDIKNLTKDKAKEIYYNNYYKPIQDLGITDPKAAYALYDLAVNSGIGKAKEFATKYGNDYVGIMSARKGYYDAIIKNDPSQEKFRKGWGNRLKSVDNFVGGGFTAQTPKMGSLTEQALNFQKAHPINSNALPIRDIDAELMYYGKAIRDYESKFKTPDLDGEGFNDVASKTAPTKNTSFLQGVYNAVSESYDWVKEHPQEAGKIAGKTTLQIGASLLAGGAGVLVGGRTASVPAGLAVTGAVSATLNAGINDIYGDTKNLTMSENFKQLATSVGGDMLNFAGIGWGSKLVQKVNSPFAKKIIPFLTGVEPVGSKLPKTMAINAFSNVAQDQTVGLIVNQKPNSLEQTIASAGAGAGLPLAFKALSILGRQQSARSFSIKPDKTNPPLISPTYVLTDSGEVRAMADATRGQEVLKAIPEIGLMSPESANKTMVQGRLESTAMTSVLDPNNAMAKQVMEANTVRKQIELVTENLKVAVAGSENQIKQTALLEELILKDQKLSENLAKTYSDYYGFPPESHDTIFNKQVEIIDSLQKGLLKPEDVQAKIKEANQVSDAIEYKFKGDEATEKLILNETARNQDDLFNNNPITETAFKVKPENADSFRQELLDTPANRTPEAVKILEEARGLEGLTKQNQALFAKMIGGQDPENANFDNYSWTQLDNFKNGIQRELDKATKSTSPNKEGKIENLREQLKIATGVQKLVKNDFEPTTVPNTLVPSLTKNFSDVATITDLGNGTSEFKWLGYDPAAKTMASIPNPLQNARNKVDISVMESSSPVIKEVYGDNITDQVSKYDFDNRDIIAEAVKTIEENGGDPVKTLFQEADIREQEINEIRKDIAIHNRILEGGEYHIDPQVDNLRKDLMEKFGLDEEKATANAIIMDAIFDQMSKRKGVNKADIYNQIQILKSDIKDLTARDQVKYQIIGERGSKFSDEINANLHLARVASSFKMTPEKIYAMTGWQKNPEGLWEFDLVEQFTTITKKDGTLSDVLPDYNHFDLYPELREINVKFEKLDDKSNGYYNPDTNTIGLNSSKSLDDNLITMVHEIQHAIQKIEGFSTGTNPETTKFHLEQRYKQAETRIAMLRAEYNKLLQEKDYKNFKFAFDHNQNLFDTGAINEAKYNENKVDLELKLRENKVYAEFLKGSNNFKNDFGVRFDTFKQTYKTKGDYATDRNAYEMYALTYGEMQARNSEKRLVMTPEERKNSLLSETLDRSPADALIFRDNIFKRSTNILRQDAHGATEFLENGNMIIHALTNPNASTPVHEVFHVFETVLTDAEKQTIMEWERGLDPKRELAIKTNSAKVAELSKNISNLTKKETSLKDEFNNYANKTKLGIEKLNGSLERVKESKHASILDKIETLKSELESNTTKHKTELNDLAKEKATTAKDLRSAENALTEAKTLKWTRETSEAFARGGERYLADGRSPNKSLQIIFNDFKNWLTDIYQGIKGSGVDLKLNKGMKKIYDSMIGDIENPQIQAMYNEIKLRNKYGLDTKSSVLEQLNMVAKNKVESYQLAKVLEAYSATHGMKFNPDFSVSTNQLGYKQIKSWFGLLKNSKDYMNDLFSKQHPDSVDPFTGAYVDFETHYTYNETFFNKARHAANTVKDIKNLDIRNPRQVEAVATAYAYIDSINRLGLLQDLGERQGQKLNPMVLRHEMVETFKNRLKAYIAEPQTIFAKTKDKASLNKLLETVKGRSPNFVFFKQFENHLEQMETHIDNSSLTVVDKLWNKVFMRNGYDTFFKENYQKPVLELAEKIGIKKSENNRGNFGQLIVGGVHAAQSSVLTSTGLNGAQAYLEGRGNLVQTSLDLENMFGINKHTDLSQMSKSFLKDRGFGYQGKEIFNQVASATFGTKINSKELRTPFNTHELAQISEQKVGKAIKSIVDGVLAVSDSIQGLPYRIAYSGLENEMAHMAARITEGLMEKGGHSSVDMFENIFDSVHAQLKTKSLNANRAFIASHLVGGGWANLAKVADLPTITNTVDQIITNIENSLADIPRAGKPINEIVSGVLRPAQTASFQFSGFIGEAAAKQTKYISDFVKNAKAGKISRDVLIDQGVHGLAFIGSLGVGGVAYVGMFKAGMKVIEELLNTNDEEKLSKHIDDFNCYKMVFGDKWINTDKLSLDSADNISMVVNNLVGVSQLLPNWLSGDSKDRGILAGRNRDMQTMIKRFNDLPAGDNEFPQRFADLVESVANVLWKGSVSNIRSLTALTKGYQKIPSTESIYDFSQGYGTDFSVSLEERNKMEEDMAYRLYKYGTAMLGLRSDELQVENEKWQTYTARAVKRGDIMDAMNEARTELFQPSKLDE